MFEAIRVNTLIKKLCDATDTKESLEISRELVKLEPNIPHYHYNHAMICADLALWGEATESLKIAHRLKPKCPVVRRMLSVGLLTTGHFKEGLMHLEARLDPPLPDSPISQAAFAIGPRIKDRYEKPYWNGVDDLNDKTVLVFNEGGHGDIIQNVRYIPQIKAKKVILEAKKEVVKVLANTKGVDEMMTCGTMSEMLFTDKLDYSKVDCVVSLHSLIYYFDPSLDAIPMTMPYVFPVEDSACVPAEIVKASPARVKIGIVWAGNKGHNNDFNRSTFRKYFEPLMKIEGVQLFSLQKGDMVRIWPDGNVDLMEDSEAVQTIDLGPLLRDFNDTALVLRELDALVSVDTSTTHLAGAINTPVWSIMPDRAWAEWRWQKKWYDSQRVFYRNGDWLRLLEEVATDITNYMKGK